MNDPQLALRQLRKNSGFTAVIVAFGLACSFRAQACTIFVLTDGHRVLFFNNEDWSNPVTRVWFRPDGEGRYGGVYLGFDNGWVQGGMNTRGLAFDWLAGFMERWKPGDDLHFVRGNPAERMLERCAMVDEAVAFFRTHREPDFARSRILIADRTGASVIVGARNGELFFDRSRASRGMSFNEPQLQRDLAKDPPATFAAGLAILASCAQHGEFATKYANVFDLKTGAIRVHPFHAGQTGFELHLGAELEKGPHYYDIPKLAEQRAKPGLPLRSEMKRIYLGEFPTITDTEPALTRRLERIVQESMQGKIRAEDYTAEFWDEIKDDLGKLKSELSLLGSFVSLKPVESVLADDRTIYRYLLEFDRIVALQRYEITTQGRIAAIQSEVFELKAPLQPRE